MPTRINFRARGFVFPPGRFSLTDPEDYHDFKDKTWKDIEMLSDLKAGVLPPGLIILADGGGAGVVVDDPDGGQMIKPVAEVI